ncbi:MAG TPA: ROK family protein [Brevundimonas sp.]|uniref:ROK family protein n=1 Tax=Brevundimonas sp. TaxID=1871086 RepID=UPI0026291D96|nr:ROK family protein [Brevundimonas sp.]HRO31911.1 ROK family protein [Brevundimonas sp.]
MRIGVDFGGTKIEAAVLTADGAFSARLREPNPGDYDAAIATVGRLIARVEAQAGMTPGGPVGLAVPGSPSPQTGLMRNANSTWLNGRAFGADLEAALGRPVRLANDADCLAVSEARDGSGAGARTVFAAILGTGCGGGVVVDGRLVSGANGIAGEWGHTPLPWSDDDEHPGPDCWCGRRNCLELWLSGSGLQRDHQTRTGHALTAQAIVAQARADDAGAARTLDRFTDRLGRALAVVADILDPDVFVLGGGLSNVDEIYGRLPPLVARHVFADRWQGRIVPARWGDSSGVRGAAWLWDAAG